MTLYFIDPDTAHKIGYRILDRNPMGLASVSDVIVVVGKDDEWVTTMDRTDVRGKVVHPKRRAELLENYYTVTRQNEPADEEEE